MKEILSLAIAELQVKKNGKVTIEDITESWTSEKLKEYDGILIDSTSTIEKKIIMKKDEVMILYNRFI